MANAQKEIEERKRALKVKPDMESVLRNKKALSSVGSVYNQGFLSKTDSEKAKKIAELLALIQNKLKSGLLAALQEGDKPRPLILDESGKTVDITGILLEIRQA